MPMLSERIWRQRLEAEHSELSVSGEHFECNDDYTRYIVSLRAPALYKNGGVLLRRDSHSVQIDLKREFPYPGSVEVTWLTPIFHPNIRREDGKVCIQLLNEWKESHRLADLIYALKRLLAEPNPLNALDKEAADFFADHPEEVKKLLTTPPATPSTSPPASSAASLLAAISGSEKPRPKIVGVT